MNRIRLLLISTLEADRWHLWVPATALALVAYWQTATLWLESANAKAAKPLTGVFAFTQLVYHPKPFDLPVYLAGYLVIPLMAFGLVALAERLHRAGFLTDRFLRRWPFALLAIALLAVVLKMGLHLTRFELWRQLPPRGELKLQGLLVGSVLVGAIITRWRSLQNFIGWLERLPWSKLRWVVVAVIAVMVFTPNFPVDLDHYNGHLGPARDLMFGKQFLRETSSFYGLLDIYTLAGMFKFFVPVSYQAFSVVLMAAFGVWYLGWYALLRRWLKSEAVAALAVLAMAVSFNMPYLNFDGYGSPSNTPYHQLGVLAVAWLMWRYSRAGAQSRRAELGLSFGTALALYWSTDVGLYILAAVVSVFFFRALMLERSWPRALGVWLRQAAQLGGIILAFGAAYSVTQFGRFGQWPDWAMLYRAARFYQSGYMLLPLPSHGVYFLYLFAFFVALGYILWQGFYRRQTGELLVPLFVVNFSILQMIYYISRPHTGNLAPRISALLVVILAWGYTQWRPAGARFMELTRAATVLGAGLLLFVGVYGAWKFGYTLRARDYVHWRAQYQREPLRQPDFYGGSAVSVLDDVAVIKRDYASIRPLPLIHWLDGKMLLDLNTVNWLPIYTLQSVFSKPQMDGLIALVHEKKPPFIFVGRVGTPGYEGFREYTDKIEYFRQGVEGWYVLERQLVTLDVLALIPQ